MASVNAYGHEKSRRLLQELHVVVKFASFLLATVGSIFAPEQLPNQFMNPVLLSPMLIKEP